MHVTKGRYVFGVVFGLALLAAALLVVTIAPAADSETSQGGPVPPPPPKVKCFGKKATLVGDDGPNVLNGTFADDPPNGDVIHGLGGSDNIRGEADFSGTPEGDADRICGGEGDDGLLDGADKSDKVSGGPGDDIVDGDNFPSEFGDILKGDDGDDTLTGGQGNDKSDGGDGNDEIDVGTGTVPEGADKIKGGKGDDTINGVDDGSVDKINCGKGTDTVTPGPEDKVKKNCEDVVEPPV